MSSEIKIEKISNGYVVTDVSNGYKELALSINGVTEIVNKILTEVSIKIAEEEKERTDAKEAWEKHWNDFSQKIEEADKKPWWSGIL